MELNFHGKQITASFDGTPLATVESTAHTHGMFALGTGWGHIQFDNLSIMPNSEMIHAWKTIEGFSVDSFLDAAAIGSLTLSGECQSISYFGDPVFTGFIDQPPSTPIKNQEDALNFLSHVQPHISWARQTNGSVQVLDDRAKSVILDLKLKRIEIINAVDGTEAVNQLMATKEINDFLVQHHIQWLKAFSQSEIFGGHLKKESSLSPNHSLTIDNVTVREALDRIIQDFPGVWIYSECPGRISLKATATRIPAFWHQSESKKKD